MRISATSLRQYIEQAGKFGPDLAALDALIRTTAPDIAPLPEPMQGGFGLGYGEMHYKPRSAKVSKTWPLLCLAAQKNYVALYVCAVVDGSYVAERHGQSLGKVSVGKSCIRFKRLADINESALRSMLADLNQRYKAGELMFGQ